MKGLTNQEILERVKAGQVNTLPKPLVKSYRQIIFEHVFTLFNLYNFIIACALASVKAWTSMFFVVLVSSNVVIRIYQEIKSRNMVAKLNLIISPKTKVLRNGEVSLINNEEIVLDDHIFLETGNQIPSDCIVLDHAVEVDESLLTGEADPVLKDVGDHLLSGSFIISGACYGKVEHVGIENYAAKIADEARKRQPVQSDLIKFFTKVTKMTSLLVIPLSIILLFQAYYIRQENMYTVIVNSSTALLGMLPVGLVLLTSISMMASVVRLGHQKVLVQEMFSIETLSHVDVLCLDKTGTLTQGKMEVKNIYCFDHNLPYQIDELMCSFVEGSLDNNATFLTLASYFKGQSKYKTVQRVPFSSARKWSALELENIGTIIVGAGEFILPNLVLPKKVEQAKQQGARVLLVAYHPDFSRFQESMHKATALACIIIEDPLRSDAKETISFFKDNEVDLKVISGDNPTTVGALARQAGIENSDKYIDATKLETHEQLENAILNYNVIGRATPYQKHQMINILKAHGLKVAMTGDGVNDVLALKDADVSIAMGSGSDAAKQIAQFVMIDSRLKTLIDVVKEGRLDINNVTRSASMYYLKTIYTILIAISIIILNIPYPFIPFQMTLMDNFVSGFPSFMILFERNIDKQKESIGRYVIRYSFPNALAIVCSVIGLKLFANNLGLDLSEVFTILYFSTSLISIHMIYRIYAPLNLYRLIVLILDIVGFIIATMIFWNWLELASLNIKLITYIGVTVTIGVILVEIIGYLIKKYLDKTSSI